MIENYYKRPSELASSEQKGTSFTDFRYGVTHEEVNTPFSKCEIEKCALSAKKVKCST